LRYRNQTINRNCVITASHTTSLRAFQWQIKNCHHGK